MDDPFMEPGDPDLIEPLMSQLVVETCLQIPTYLMSSDGWDRSLAREAFKADLPREIALRRNKGAVHGNMKAMFRRNRDLTDSLVRGGLLAQHGLLDEGAWDAMLTGSPGSTAYVMEAYHMLAAEARLRAWNVG
jgi:asparagine synthase (glutamine-hydrolysing)